MLLDKELNENREIRKLNTRVDIQQEYVKYHLTWKSFGPYQSRPYYMGHIYSQTLLLRFAYRD